MFSIQECENHILLVWWQVSVPSRGLCFQSQATIVTYYNANSFRPLSGIMFSIVDIKSTVQKLSKKFPSPLGDYVFNHGTINGSLRIMKIKFPSPLGDYVFNLKFNFGKHVNRIVSVPSRGLCFQSKYNVTVTQVGIFGFRPLSGIMFSIGWKTRTRNSRPRSFPSPLGDYVFNHAYNSAILCINKSVSVPSRGLCFQSCRVYRLRLWHGDSFRPLSGIMFSIEHISAIVKMRKRVSVPSRGLCFQSEKLQMKRLKQLWFPSPLGDYVFNQTKEGCVLDIKHRFRPLSGIMFSI